MSVIENRSEQALRERIVDKSDLSKQTVRYYDTHMRVEPHTIDSIVHVVKRGARGLPITRNIRDQERFYRLLYYCNDTHRDEYWERAITGLAPFVRPTHWPERNPLVKVLAWTLMPNHLHLVLKEVREGGIAKFMQKLCGSMTTHFNAKYKEHGSLFQGAYRGRTADLHGDTYLRYLAVYVMVKNPFELYSGGLIHAIEHFNQAYEWAIRYRFCSLADYAVGAASPIIEKDIFGELFNQPKDLKEFARECMQYHLNELSDFDFKR